MTLSVPYCRTRTYLIPSKGKCNFLRDAVDENIFALPAMSIPLPQDESQPMIPKPNDSENPPLVPDGAVIVDDTPKFGFLFFGIVGLLCFNCFLQVTGYLNASFNANFTGWANTIYSFSNNCGQLIAIFTGARFDFFSRIWVSCLGLALVLVGYPLLAMTKLSIGCPLAYGLTIGMGAFNAILQSAGFGLAGSVSASAINYYCFGQALAGLLGLPMLMTLEYGFKAFGLSDVPSVAGKPSVVDSMSTLTGLGIAALLTLALIPYYRFGIARNGLVAQTLLVVEPAKPGSTTSSTARQRPYVEIISSTLPLGLTVWVLLFVTFLVFPSQIFLWKPSFEHYPGGKFFYPGMLIYVFQIFDVVGRYLAVAGVGLSPFQVKLLSPWRFMLVVLFYLCSYEVWVFKFDLVRIVLMAVLATSNGWLVSWAMVHGPGQVSSENADVASYTMSFSLVNGILFGSLVSLAVAHVISVSPTIGSQIDESMQQLVSVPGVPEALKQLLDRAEEMPR